MTTPDAGWYTRIESKIDQVLAALHGEEPEEPGPGVLLAPTGFSAVYDDTNRTVACSWDPTGNTVELHEFMTDPSSTLKATLGPGVTSRISTPLKGGHPYVWAVRSVRDNQVSVFSPKITTDVPAQGEAEPEEPGPSEPEQPEEPGTGTTPADVLDLRAWTLMLPIMKTDGDTPKNDYAVKWGTLPEIFFVRGGAVVCRTPPNGDHSKGSKFPRTELRQMRNPAPDWEEAAWSSSGDHSLECDMAIDASHLFTRRRINGMQIHDGADDVCQIMRHESDGLGLMHSDGNAWVSIDPTYRDGQRFRCRIHAVSNRIKVYYNDMLAADIPKVGTGWFWKMGCYLQTGGSSKFIEPSGTYGEVVIYSYALTGGGS